MNVLLALSCRLGDSSDGFASKKNLQFKCGKWSYLAFSEYRRYVPVSGLLTFYTNLPCDFSPECFHSNIFSSMRKTCSSVQSFHVGVGVMAVDKTHNLLPLVTLNNSSLPWTSFLSLYDCSYIPVECYVAITNEETNIMGDGNYNKHMCLRDSQFLVRVKWRLDLHSRILIAASFAITSFQLHSSLTSCFSPLLSFAHVRVFCYLSSFSSLF